jgi:predicted metal-dependent HD superfamily phosphohydrolase
MTTFESPLIQRAQSVLQPLYEQPDRAYHGLAHIQALLTHLQTHADQVHDPQAVALAIWFHDAVYDTTRDDNEAQSAALAARHLQDWGCPAEQVDAVVRMVEATARHQWVDGNLDAAWFLDFDLSILASSPLVYDRYSAQIQREYGWVPPQAYRPARARVLQSFLDRPFVYFTPALRSQWEAAARANLARELAALSSS